MAQPVEVRGAQELIELLGALPGEVKKAARTSLNRQVTATRKELIVQPAMQATGIKRATLNADMPLSKAGSNDLRARVRASGAGIPVPAYRWSHEPTGSHPTRHRIKVGWPGGDKVAAGFVNPFGQYQAPLTTRRKGIKLGVALGMSAATIHKAIYSAEDQRQTADGLAEKFNTFLSDIVSRRPIPDE